MFSLAGSRQWCHTGTGLGKYYGTFSRSQRRTFETDLRGNVDDVGVVFERSFALGEGDHVLHHTRHLFSNENHIIARVFESIHFVDQLDLFFVEVCNLVCIKSRLIRLVV